MEVPASAEGSILSPSGVGRRMAGVVEFKILPKAIAAKVDGDLTISIVVWMHDVCLLP